MAGPLDLRGRVVITDGATGTLNRIKASLDGVGQASRRLTTGQYLSNIAHSVRTGAQRLHQGSVQLSGAAATVGVGLGGIIASTKDFNESKFGYGFARLTDYLKNGKLEVASWKKDMDQTARWARDAAKSYGTTADIAMKAREEVEKVGFKGKNAESLFGAALGLHLSEPKALESGAAVKYLNAVYRAYADQRDELAKKIGADAKDPAFIQSYLKGLAAKSAVAGAESALGPADVVAGMRQYAPQWAAMGIPFEFALAALAHGSNFGFGASELGTAYKSKINKIIMPTAGGLGILNNLQIDRARFFKAGAVEPGKAATAINSLLSGSVYAGKGGAKNKAAIRAMLDEAYKTGSTTSPEFQEALTNRVAGMLGKPWAGRIQEIQQAVANATLNASGDVDLPGFIKALRDAGATVGQIATIFEGRHIARNMPLFKFYEDLIALYDKLKAVDGTVMDAVVEGRKNTEAGTTDQLLGAWKELMLAMQDTGVIETAKTALIRLAEALRALPSDVVKWGTGLTIVAGGIAAVGAVLGATLPLFRAAGLLTTAAATGAVSAGAAVAGSSVVAGAAARLGLLFVPGIGLVTVMAGAGGLEAYNEYQKGGSWWDVTKGFVSGASGWAYLQRWLAGEQEQAPQPPQPGQQSRPPEGMPAIWNSVLPSNGPTDAQSTLDKIRSVYTTVDLSSEGQRVMETFAAGIRAGGQDAINAAQLVAAGVREAAWRSVPLNTGPAMRGAQ